MRAVIDTNLWISFLFGKKVADLLTLIQNGKVEVVTDARQIAEIEEVLSRPKIKKIIGPQRLATMLRFIHRKAKLITAKRRIKACRDPNDDYLLEIAVEAKAAFLVSGDSDLLELDPFRSVRIVSYRDFKELLEELSR
ncbi:MAG: putative toxin-antitoxin system toxin component, PIN family [Candidatus Sulfotelmatobacter sp.]